MQTIKKIGSLLLISVLLSSCATSKDQLLPAGEQSMLDLWQGEGSGGHRGIVQARQALRRPLTASEIQVTSIANQSYSRTQQREIQQQFPRLPNPDLVMYVFPHLAQGNAPIPGYSTVFPFYREVQYALPGERTEPY